MNAFTRDILEKRGYVPGPDGALYRPDSHAPLTVDALTRSGPANNAANRADSKPKPKKRGPSPLATKFEEMWKELGGPALTPEFRFHKTRKWRFDYCHERTRVAIELDGGIFCEGKKRGRHSRGTGYQGDCDKLNAASEDGYFVFRIATGMVSEDRLEAILRTIRRLSFT